MWFISKDVKQWALHTFGGQCQKPYKEETIVINIQYSSHFKSRYIIQPLYSIQLFSVSILIREIGMEFQLLMVITQRKKNNFEIDFFKIIDCLQSWIICTYLSISSFNPSSLCLKTILTFGLTMSKVHIQKQ